MCYHCRCQHSGVVRLNDSSCSFWSQRPPICNVYSHISSKAWSNLRSMKSKYLIKRGPLTIVSLLPAHDNLYVNDTPYIHLYSRIKFTEWRNNVISHVCVDPRARIRHRHNRNVRFARPAIRPPLVQVAPAQRRKNLMRKNKAKDVEKKKREVWFYTVWDREG